MNNAAITILLLEGDPGDAQMTCDALATTETKFAVSWVTRLDDALDQLEAAHFDVIVADLSLLQSEPDQTVAMIRDAARDTAIVVATSHSGEDLALTLLDSGIQDYLLKEELSRKVLERSIRYSIQRQQCRTEIDELIADLQDSRDQLQAQKELLERKNRRLKRLYRTAQRFVDNVSHEFRTPLTVIKDYIGLVREGVAGQLSPDQCRLLDIAAVRTDDLNNMVDDMLDVNKLESGLLGAWRRNSRVEEILGQTVPALAQKAKVRNIRFDVNVDPGLPKVYCDEHKVGRVIINLITNAMRFCKDPGHISLSATCDDDAGEVVIAVTDNGPGIEPKDLDVIFKRFKQLGTHVSQSNKHFGLGLNIAKELVELNLGEMRVESEHGSGSTFSFSVPLAHPDGVIRRYVDRIERMRNGSSCVSLVTATIDRYVSDSDAHDVDVLLNYLLRSHDLLFRRDSHSWMSVLPIPEMEVERYIARVQGERDKANRNRPEGPMPRIDLDIKGCWYLAKERAGLFEQARAILKPPELTVVF